MSPTIYPDNVILLYDRLVDVLIAELRLPLRQPKMAICLTNIRPANGLIKSVLRRVYKKYRAAGHMMILDQYFTLKHKLKIAVRKKQQCNVGI